MTFQHQSLRAYIEEVAGALGGTSNAAPSGRRHLQETSTIFSWPEGKNLYDLIKSTKETLDSTVVMELKTILRRVNELNANNTKLILNQLAEESKTSLDKSAMETDLVLLKMSNLESEMTELELILRDADNGLPTVLKSREDILREITKVNSAIASAQNLVTSEASQVNDHVDSKVTEILASIDKVTAAVATKASEVTSEVGDRVDSMLSDALKQLIGEMSLMKDQIELKSTVALSTSKDDVLQTNAQIGSKALEIITNVKNEADQLKAHMDTNIKEFEAYFLSLREDFLPKFSAVLDKASDVEDILIKGDSSLSTIKDATISAQASTEKILVAIQGKIDEMISRNPKILSTSADARNSESLSLVAETERIARDIKEHTSEVGDNISSGVGILEDRINGSISTQANKMLSTISAEATSTRSAVNNSVATLQKDVSDAQKYLQEKVVTKAEINVLKSEIGAANNITTSNAMTEMKSKVTNAKADVVFEIEVARNDTASVVETMKTELAAKMKSEIEAAQNATSSDITNAKAVLESEIIDAKAKIEAVRSEMKLELSEAKAELEALIGKPAPTTTDGLSGDVARVTPSGGEASVGSALGASLGLEVDVRCLPRMRNSNDGAVMLDVMVNTQSYGDDCDANITQVLAVYTNKNGDYKSQTGQIQDVTPIATGMHIVRFILNKDGDANFEIQYVTSLRITATKKENAGGMYKKSVILDYSGCYEMHRQAAQNSKTNRLLERTIKLLRSKFKQTL